MSCVPPRCLVAALLYFAAILSAAPTPQLVKDIRAGEAEASFNPKMQASLGQHALLTGNDAVHGEELWISDGTTVGTHLVKDIWPGLNGSFISGVTVAGNRAFFSARDEIHGQELWVTDGTEAGTFLVADLVAGAKGISPEQMTPCGDGVVFISSQEYTDQISVWYSDGTRDGTRKIGRAPQTPRRSGTRVCSDGTHAWVFLPDSTSPREELWRVQGTGPALTLAKIHSFEPDVSVNPLGVLDGDLLFQVFTSHPHYLNFFYQAALWKSSDSGTVQIKPISEVLFQAISTVPEQMVTANGKAYFISRRRNSSPSAQVWVTDGTAGGTQPQYAGLVELNTPVELNLLGQKLIITGDTGIGSYDLQQQTMEIILLGHSQFPVQALRQVTRFGSQLLFRGSLRSGSPTHPSRFWISDGTAAGTRYLSETFSPPSEVNWQFPYEAATPVVVADHTAFFSAGPEGGDIELWKTDGTSAGTVAVTDVKQPDAGSFPQQMQSFGGLLYFTSDDGVHGRELWRSDSSPQGTFLLSDIRPGSAASEPLNMVELNGVVYFTALDDVHGRELWRTDGTPEGTTLVIDLMEGEGHGVTGALVLFKGRLFFNSRGKLWSTDGTAEGTQLYAPAVQESTTLNPKNITVMDGWLYFNVYLSSLNRSDILRIDGISDAMDSALNPESYPFPGTVRRMLVRPPTPGAAVAPEKHVLFIVAYNQLWRCCNGEFAVRIDLPSLAPDVIDDIQLHGDGILFVRDADSQGDTLWRSDGTPAGTRQWGPRGKVWLLDQTAAKIYYTQSEAGPTGYIHHSFNCMNLDGSGQVVLSPSEILPGFLIDSPNNQYRILHVEGETVYFAHSLDNSIWFLGKTQGTLESTQKISPLSLSAVPDLDIPPNNTSIHVTSEPGARKMGSRLYFAANEGLLGDELYSLDLGGYLEISDLTEGGTEVLESGDALQFPLTPVGQESQARSIRLFNAGSQTLTHIAVSLSPESDFKTDPPGIGPLPPGEMVELAITFSPTTGGLREDTLQITATGSEVLTYTLQLSGHSLGEDDPAVFWPPLGPVAALTGDTVTIQPGIISALPIRHYLWYKNGVLIQTTETLVLPAVQAADAASYTLTVYPLQKPSSTSPAFPLVIAPPAPATVWFVPGQNVTLDSGVTAPPGTDVFYMWMNENDEAIGVHPTLTLSAEQATELAGSSRVELMIAVDLAHSDYTLPPAILRTGRTELRQMGTVTPQVPETGHHHYLGEEVSLQLEAEEGQPVDSYVIKGLPPGLTASATGLITGSPKKVSPIDRTTGLPRPYSVTITATNAAGAGPETTLLWTIHPLLAIGTHEALIGRDANLDEGLSLGSYLKITTNSAGSLSGQILHRGKTWRFASPVLLDTSWPQTGATFQCLISRGKILPALHLTIATGDAPSVTLTNSTFGGSGSGDLRRQLTPQQAAATYHGPLYTCTLKATDYSPGDPGGTGYITATVSSKGSVRWKGKLADGTAITGSSILSRREGETTTAIPIHKDLYKLKGSLHGWAFFHLGAGHEIPPQVTGDLTWNKTVVNPDPRDRVYKNGFLQHDVTLSGGLHTPPARGEMLFGLEANETGDLSPNLTFTASGINLPFLIHTQDILLGSNNKVKLPKVSAETPLKSLTFNAKTGTFKGSFTLLHPENTKLNRTTSFEGILPNQVNDDASGFFLLPDLPEAEGETLRNTAIQSGHVEIGTLNP